MLHCVGLHCLLRLKQSSVAKIDHNLIIIPIFFFLEKKGYINFVFKSVRRPSVRPSVTFLVNVSPPKPLEVATSNFVVE